MTTLRKTYLTLVLAILMTQIGVTQSIVEEEKIDALFTDWEDPNKPGGAAAFLYNNELVYAKGFGMANLETGKRNDINTAFQLAELSRHFTAFALLLLEDEGVVALDDDIRKYVPEVPDFGELITLNHLLTHSSGLYDLGALRHIAGWDDHDRFDKEDVIKLISRQQKLNFSPGSNFAYSETGITLLSMVIEKATDKSLKAYAQEMIFDPAGMTNTWFGDGNNLPMGNKNIAQAYVTNDEVTEKVKPFYTISGPVNLYSSISDLVKWQSNLLNPTVGNRKIIEKLNAIVTLPNGKEFSSPQGKLTYGQQFYHKERGITELYRTGYYAGYTSAIFRFDQKGFVAIILSNDGSYYRGYLGMETAYLFLEDTFLEPSTIDYTKVGAKKLKVDKLKSYTGSYWDEEGGISRQIIFENDSLYYYRRPGNQTALVPLGNDRFQMKVTWDDKIYLQFENAKGGMKMQYLNGESDPYRFFRYQPVEYAAGQLKEFEGSFYNEEYNLSFKAEVKEGKLSLSNFSTGEMVLAPAMENQFTGATWFLRSIEYDENGAGEKTGFNVSYEGIRSLWFEKI